MSLSNLKYLRLRGPNMEVIFGQESMGYVRLNIYGSYV